LDHDFASGLKRLAEPWRAALRLAWEAHGAGNVGVGAVLTDPSGLIVARGRNRVRDTDAPPGRLRSTRGAHAELDVLGQLSPGDDPGHALWTTLEPCLLCLAAVVLSHRHGALCGARSPVGRHRRPAAARPSGCPTLAGPGRTLGGPITALCALLPPIRALEGNPDGVVTEAHASCEAALLALARRLMGDKTLDGHRGQPIEVLMERLWDELCHLAAPRADARSGEGAIGRPA